MGLLARLERLLFAPPEPPCKRTISAEQEEEEHAKWRVAVHGNRGASSRTDAAAQSMTREMKRNKTSLSHAEQVVNDMIRLIETRQRGDRRMDQIIQEHHEDRDAKDRDR
jgi:hypothetical protein